GPESITHLRSHHLWVSSIHSGKCLARQTVGYLGDTHPRLLQTNDRSVYMDRSSQSPADPSERDHQRGDDSDSFHAHESAWSLGNSFEESLLWLCVGSGCMGRLLGAVRARSSRHRAAI